MSETRLVVDRDCHRGILLSRKFVFFDERELSLSEVDGVRRLRTAHNERSG